MHPGAVSDSLHLSADPRHHRDPAVAHRTLRFRSCRATGKALPRQDSGGKLTSRSVRDQGGMAAPSGHLREADPMYRNILVPIDPEHGPVGARILAVAQRLSGGEGQITLLTVVPTIPAHIS